MGSMKMSSVAVHVNTFIKDLLDSDHLPLLAPDVQVSVVGVAVDVVSPDPELHPTRPLVVTLDDGTGVVKCAMFRHQGYQHLRQVKIGDCFLARGVVGEYFQQTQIKCSALKRVEDPDFETLWINKVLLEKKNRESRQSQKKKKKKKKKS